LLSGNVNWQPGGVAASSGGSSFAGVWSEVPGRPLRKNGSRGLDIDIRAAFVRDDPTVDKIELGELHPGSRLRAASRPGERPARPPTLVGLGRRCRSLGGDIGWDDPKAFTLGLLDEALRSTRNVAAQIVRAERDETLNLPVIDAALAPGRLTGLTGKDKMVRLRTCLDACTAFTQPTGDPRPT